jgi:hypothetical protein
MDHQMNMPSLQDLSFGAPEELAEEITLVVSKI